MKGLPSIWPRQAGSTPKAQSEHNYLYFTLICPFLRNAGRITHGKQNWKKTGVGKSEALRVMLPKVTLSSMSSTCKRHPLPHCFISAYSSGIAQNLVPGTCKVQALFRTEVGSWECSVLFQTGWKPGRIQPSYFWQGEGALRGEVEERDSWRIYWSFLLNSTIWVFKWV